jgi:voltage-gated sodium channel
VVVNAATESGTLPRNMIPQFLKRVTESSWFQNTILALIIATAIIVGLETDRGFVADYGHILLTLDWIIIWAFVLEALMKLGAQWPRPWRYFRDPWNCFDFSVIALVFILMPFGDGHFAAVLRMIRVLRTLRLITVIPRLQLIVSSLLRSLPSMFYVGLLLFLLFYVYAVIGVFLFRDNDPTHFGDLPTSLLTLFRVVTLEDWTDVMYTQMYGHDVFPAEFDRGAGDPEPHARPFVGMLYFVSFVLLGTIIVLNLVIGVILSSMQEAQIEQDRDALNRARAAGVALTMDEEIQAIEHQLEEMKRHLVALRARARNAESAKGTEAEG